MGSRERFCVKDRDGRRTMSTYITTLRWPNHIAFHMFLCHFWEMFQQNNLQWEEIAFIFYFDNLILLIWYCWKFSEKYLTHVCPPWWDPGWFVLVHIIKVKNGLQKRSHVTSLCRLLACSNVLIIQHLYAFMVLRTCFMRSGRGGSNLQYLLQSILTKFQTA